MSFEELLTQFENHIVESAKNLAEKEVHHQPDWFFMSEKIF